MMPSVSTGSLRRGCAVLGAVSSAATLLTAAAIWTVPTLTPVGTVVAVVISVTTLSLPVVTGGLLYSLRGGVPGAAVRTERLLWGVISGALGVFVTGTVAVVSGIEPVRTVGDWLYAVGIVALFVVSVVTLVAEAR